MCYTEESRLFGMKVVSEVRHERGKCASTEGTALDLPF